MVSGYRLIESREQSLITTALIVRSTQVKRAAVVSFLVRITDSKDELQQTVPQGRFVAKLLNNLFGRRCRSLADDLSLKFRAAIQEEYSGVKPGRTRLNFAYFPKEELLCTIEFVADYAQRFLPLYEFDRQSGNWKYKEENNINTTGMAKISTRNTWAPPWRSQSS
ncbi:hypothetical protein SELMODRAFT_419481 [Selaginella moellendorffii]|uniref:Uncharacterized protein n=1 Tax=Selaginella moellendorffii TaxID=88036 RepID=D8S933_SELML|nr:hypothetical protein SELMODRAFT_419481 [Selaginella moellendorffii]